MVTTTMVFRSELQPITPERFLGIDSSSSSPRRRDLVFIVNPQGLFSYSLFGRSKNHFSWFFSLTESWVVIIITHHYFENQITTLYSFGDKV